jgi:hypothetical protein
MLGMTPQAGIANRRGIAEYFFGAQKIPPAISQGFGLWIQGDRNCIVAFEGAILWQTVCYRNVSARTTVAYVLLFGKHMRSPLMASFLFPQKRLVCPLSLRFSFPEQ